MDVCPHKPKANLKWLLMNTCMLLHYDRLCLACCWFTGLRAAAANTRTFSLLPSALSCGSGCSIANWSLLNYSLFLLPLFFILLFFLWLKNPWHLPPTDEKTAITWGDLGGGTNTSPKLLSRYTVYIGTHTEEKSKKWKTCWTCAWKFLHAWSSLSYGS